MELRNEIKGALAGSFLAGSLINPYGMIIQGMLFVLGFLILFDCFFTEEHANTGTSTIMFLVGCMASIITSSYGVSPYYLLSVFVLNLYTYHGIIKKEIGKMVKK
jgi:hypothetical protein